MKRRYYSLIASLPQLPHFERAERLPINRVRLDQRLAALHPRDAMQLTEAEVLIEWHHQPFARTEAQVAARYRAVMQQLVNPALREFIVFRMNMRTLVAALRLRRHRSAPPAAGETWGVGPLVRWIEDHWQAEDLQLAGVYPWLPEASRLLANQRAMDLQRLLLRTVWQRAGRIADEHVFGFEHVFAFVFKWDIMQRWLRYDANTAAARFQQLTSEAMDDYQPLFN